MPTANGVALHHERVGRDDRITDATLRVYEDSGHLVLLQDPAAWPEIAAFSAA
jgi:hypothetical protein